MATIIFSSLRKMLPKQIFNSTKRKQYETTYPTEAPSGQDGVEEIQIFSLTYRWCGLRIGKIQHCGYQGQFSNNSVTSMPADVVQDHKKEEKTRYLVQDRKREERTRYLVQDHKREQKTRYLI